MRAKKDLPNPFGSNIIFVIAVRASIAGLRLGLQSGHTSKAVQPSSPISEYQDT